MAEAIIRTVGGKTLMEVSTTDFRAHTGPVFKSLDNCEVDEVHITRNGQVYLILQKPPQQKLKDGTITLG